MPFPINPQTGQPYTQTEIQAGTQKAYEDAYQSVMQRYDPDLSRVRATMLRKIEQDYPELWKAYQEKGIEAIHSMPSWQAGEFQHYFSLYGKANEEAHLYAAPIAAATTTMLGGQQATGMPDYTKARAETKVKIEEPTKAPVTEEYFGEAPAIKAPTEEYFGKPTTVPSPEEWRQIGALAEEYGEVSRGIELEIKAVDKALKVAKKFEVLPTPEEAATGKVSEGYDLEGMLAAGYVTEAHLLFPQKVIDEAQRNVQWRKEYDAASPQGKFNILQKAGQVPLNATLDHIEEDGTIHYSLPSDIQPVIQEELRDIERAFLAESNISRALIVGNALSKWSTSPEEVPRTAPIGKTWDAYTETEKQAILIYYAGLKPMNIFGITIPKGQTIEAGKMIQSGKLIVGIIPFIGTAVFWNAPAIKIGSVTIPKNVERAASILLDAAIVTSIIKPGLITGIIRSAAGTPKEIQAARAIYQEGISQASRALKSVDKTLVKPFKAMAKAQDELAQNLGRIKDLERTLARGAGEVAPELRRVLGSARKQTPTLQTTLRQTAEDFAKAQARAARAAYDDIPLIRTSFADDIVRDTRATVEAVFSEQRGIKATQREISTLLKQLDGAKRTATKAARIIEDSKNLKPSIVTQKVLAEQKQILTAAQRQASELTMRLSQAQSRLLIAKSGQAKALADKVGAIKAEINARQKELENTIREWRTHPASELDYEGRARLLRQIIKRLQKHLAIESEKFAVAAKAMEIEWAKPITRSGGRVITRQVPTILPRYVGGGVKTARGEIPMISAIGVRGARATVAGEELISTEPITLPGLPDVFTFVPGRTPYPELLIAEPATEPTTKPKTWPVYPPIPKPIPYQETYILEALRVLPQIRQKVETEAQAEALAKTLTAAGISSATATSVANRAKTEGKTASQILAEIKTETATGTAATTKTITKTMPKTALKPLLKIPVKTTVALKIKEPIEPKIWLPLPRGGTDAEKRQHIKEAGGAIAWRMGRIGKKDRWDVIVHPYSDDSHYVMVLGDPPEGATIVEKGKGSAYGTAQVIRGKGPKKKVHVDSGVVDIHVKPVGTKRVKLGITSDPQLQTKGDITIGGKTPPITERQELLRTRTPRISGAGLRISPRIPRLR